MNPLRYLEKRIRGWLPKEPNLPRNKVKMAEAPTKAFKVLWYVVVFAILALIVVAVIIFYIPFLAESLVNRTIVLVIYAMVAFALYRAYGRDYYKRHPRERRFRIMLVSGALTALTAMILLSVILAPKPYLPYLWIPFILLGVVGAFIGDRLWKTPEA
jgi:drug/metabolite transporter (DMT)-like permease